MKIVPLVDDVVFISGRHYAVSFKVVNDAKESLRGTPSFSIYLDGGPVLYAVFPEVEVEPGAEKYFETKIKIPDIEGEGTIEFMFEDYVKGVVRESMPLVVVRDGEPLYVSFIWHHHQAPQFFPDGSYKDLWPFLHVIRGSFYGYEGGPYKVHLEIHKKHPLFRDVDHLSPSLLEQWARSIEEGYRTKDEVVGRDDPRVEIIKEVLSGYREKVADDLIEPLGSVYAHTILGFLLRKSKELGMSGFVRALIEWELKRGLRIVEQMLGKLPRGAWTPEMFWEMGLVDIYSRAGIEYTVLCEQHFSRSGGEKETVYEPYVVEDPISGSRIYVFFRDIRLSDWLSFEVEFADEKQADMSARRFVIDLVKRRSIKPGGIVTIALDGENWMVMPSYKRYAPYFLERIISYIERSDIIKITTLGKYLEAHKPSKTLYYVPYGSWIGLTDSQWTGGEKDETWKYVFEKLKWVEGLYYLFPGRDQMLEDPSTPLYKAFLAAAIALDSDFYWFGEDERERGFVKTWADEAEKIAKSVFESISVSVVERGESSAILRISNGTGYPVEIQVRVESPSYKSNHNVRVDPEKDAVITIYVPGDAKVSVLAGKIQMAEL